MLCSSAASAGPADDEDPKVPDLIDWPDGQTVTKRGDLSFRDGAQYKCFPAEQYQVVAHIVVDYRWLHGYALRLELMLDNRAREVATLHSMVDIWKAQVDLLNRDRLFMEGLYQDERKLRLAQRGEGKWTRRLLIAGNVVLAAATVAVSIYAGTK